MQFNFSRIRDLRGLKFDKLLVYEFSHRERRKKQLLYFWKCRCDCGKEKTLSSLNFVHGGTKSCGCVRANNNNNFRHGLYHTFERNIWNSMLQRCNNPNTKAYKNYGGRGIKVCKRWRKLENFIEDMGFRPSNKHSLERRDNNKGYSKNNCSWELREVQANNCRSNRFIEWNGERKTVSQWAREVNIRRQTISKRIDEYGWSVSDALTCPMLQ